MKNITVVSINSCFRMANIGVWLGDNNIYGGFSKLGDEKSYYLRRLLIQPENTKNISYEKDNFELFDSKLRGLDIDLVHEVKDEPWIPNTGELYKFKKIVIKGLYSGEPSQLYDDDRSVEILPPLDQYYRKKEDANGNPNLENDSNIYQNKGAGLKFYALDGKNAILLATFNLNPATDLLEEGQSPYDVVYNGDIFKKSDVNDTITSMPKDNFDLLVANNKLTFKLKNGKALTKFGVRPMENNIRPGDDFLLRFGKRNSLDVKGSAKAEDFIAVYDKKMLWRAKLYIDTTSSGIKDWNVEHLWNAPPDSLISTLNNGKAVETVGYYSKFGFIHPNGSNSSEVKWYGINEWNKKMSDLDDYEEFKLKTDKKTNRPWEDLSNLTGSDGKQVVKYPSAIYNKYKSDSSRSVVNNYMVYNFIRTTSPFQYNANMAKQFRAMESMRDDYKLKYEKAKKDYEAYLTVANKAALDKAEKIFNLYKELNLPQNIKFLLPPKGDLSYNTKDHGDILLLWSRYAPKAPKPAAKDSLNIVGNVDLPFYQPSKTTGILKWLVWVPEPTSAYVNKLNDVQGFENFSLTEPIPAEQIYNNKQAGIDCGGLIYIYV